LAAMMPVCGTVSYPQLICSALHALHVQYVEMVVKRISF